MASEPSLFGDRLGDAVALTVRRAIEAGTEAAFRTAEAELHGMWRLVMCIRGERPTAVLLHADYALLAEERRMRAMADDPTMRAEVIARLALGVVAAAPNPPCEVCGEAIWRKDGDVWDWWHKGGHPADGHRARLATTDPRHPLFKPGVVAAPVEDAAVVHLDVPLVFGIEATATARTMDAFEPVPNCEESECGHMLASHLGGYCWACFARTLSHPASKHRFKPVAVVAEPTEEAEA